MTPDEHLEKALALMADREAAFEEAIKEYFDAESDYRVQKARAYLEADGSIQAREAQAIIAAEKYLRERNRMEAVKEFTKEKLKDVQAAVSARQSLLTASRRTNERL